MDRPLQPGDAPSRPPRAGATATSIGESGPLPGPPPRRLPDFRNLGVLLRVLLAASLLSVIGAVLIAPRVERVGWTLLDVCATVQPPLVLVLIVLAAIRPVLDRLPYPLAAGLVIALSALAAGASQHASALLLGTSTGELWRHTTLGATMAAALLSWLDLRSRALSPALIEARLQALQARIRPHFLFNSLTAVLSLIRADPRKAERVLEDLADLFRALMADSRSLSTLAREMDLARQYLAIEGLRLGERLCLRCCCSRCWRTPCATVWSPRPRAGRSGCAPVCGVAWRRSRCSTPRRLQAPPPVTGSRWTTSGRGWR